MKTNVTPLNTKAAAAMIGISPMTLRIWRCAGKGPQFTKLGREKQAGVVYFEDDILAWLGERKFASTSGYSPTAKANIRRPSVTSA